METDATNTTVVAGVAPTPGAAPAEDVTTAAASQTLSPVASEPGLATEGLRIAKARPNQNGGLEARGNAAPGAKVRLKLNGAYVAEVVADALGRWSLTVERGLTAGIYALRAEMIDSSGKPKVSTDVTFAYAPHPTVNFLPTAAPPPALGSLASADADAQQTVVAAASPSMDLTVASADPSHAVVAEIRTATVVKGDNLWDLARHFYGDGLHYSDIFQANSVQIHNPNLIYIGQVFVVPQPSSATR